MKYFEFDGSLLLTGLPYVRTDLYRTTMKLVPWLPVTWKFLTHVENRVCPKNNACISIQPTLCLLPPKKWTRSKTLRKAKLHGPNQPTIPHHFHLDHAWIFCAACVCICFTCTLRALVAWLLSVSSPFFFPQYMHTRTQYSSKIKVFTKLSPKFCCDQQTLVALLICVCVYLI